MVKIVGNLVFIFKRENGECIFNEELQRGICADGVTSCILQCVNADGTDGGECEPTGQSVESIPKDGKNILRRIFLKSYATMVFNGDSGWGQEETSYDYSFTASSDEDRTPICGDNQLDENGKRLEGEHCAIHPEIKNIGLFKGDSEVNKIDEGFVINESGRYDLKFNSIIDPEQLPLVDIQISWGDGDISVITDQDSRPDSEFPHIISHNYIENQNNQAIRIRINDNWGYNRCCIDDGNCSYYSANSCPLQCPECH